MINVTEAATRKIGPLPAFAWGGIVGGGILVFRMLRGGGSGGAESPFVQPVGGGAIDFESSGGGGGGGGTTAPVGSGATATVGGNGKSILKLKTKTGFFTKLPLAKTDESGSVGSYYVKLVTIGGHKYWQILGGVSGISTDKKKGWYIPYGKTSYSVTTTTAA